MPQAPGTLSVEPVVDLTDSQRALWEHAVLASPEGLLAEIDAYALLGWVVAADQFETARKAQAEMDSKSNQPFLIRGRTGPSISPYVKIMSDAHMRMMRAAQGLGFDPASRIRLRMAKPKEEQTQQVSPWDRIASLDGGHA